MKDQPDTGNVVKRAEAFARWAHRGQFRRDGVTPYFAHCERVARAVYGAGHNDFTCCVALLHDVLEDCGERLSLTAHDIVAIVGLDAQIAEALVAMTHHRGETYADYLRRVMSNGIAACVKRFDIIDNLNDAPTASQVKRYVSALKTLGCDFASHMGADGKVRWSVGRV